MENKQIQEISDNNLKMKIARNKFFSANHRDDEPVQVTEEDVKKFNEDVNNTALQRSKYFK